MNKHDNNLIVEYAIKNNIIESDTVLTYMRKEILSRHNSAIYQQKDGRWCTYIKENGKRKAIRVKSKDELENRLCKFYLEKESKEKSNNTTLRDLFESWLSYKSYRNKPQTIKVFRSFWNRFYEESNIVDIPIISLKKIDIEEWIYKTVRDYQMDKSQYLNLISIIKQELEYAVDKEIIQVSPFSSVKIDTKRVLKPRKKKEDDKQVFSKKDEERFFELGFNDYNNKLHPIHQLAPLASMFMFCTGLRVGEVCAIKYSDISGDCIIIQRFYNNSLHKVEDGLKAGHACREVPLSDIAKHLIELAKIRQQEELVDTDYIFSMTDDPVPYGAVRDVFYSYSRKIETPIKGSHCARKTFISKLIDENVNLNTIRKIVGHASEQTTLNNYCYDRHEKSEIHDMISNAFQNINSIKESTQVYSSS
ncbi:MAG: tyrosine-type recombinase/integrase [Mogibacterium sp.]|nr:tyrosine-type recombinase/integrase [Mogibacterium sp.]